MSPTKIMFIRHAEKPDREDLPGVAADGSLDRKSLNDEGWTRANRLIGFFAHPTARDIETPDFVFAAAPDGASKRPYETILPLVEALWPGPERAGRLNATIAKDDVDGLAAAVMERSGVVLVSWEHKVLPKAVAALPYAPATPQAWPDDRFDVVWILTPRPGGWDFRQTPEMLMAGDRDAPISF